jgi:hypothetical protein
VLNINKICIVLNDLWMFKCTVKTSKYSISVIFQVKICT